MPWYVCVYVCMNCGGVEVWSCADISERTLQANHSLVTPEDKVQIRAEHTSMFVRVYVYMRVSSWKLKLCTCAQSCC